MDAIDVIHLLRRTRNGKSLGKSSYERIASLLWQKFVYYGDRRTRKSVFVHRRLFGKICYDGELQNVRIDRASVTREAIENNQD